MTSALRLMAIALVALVAAGLAATPAFAATATVTASPGSLSSAVTVSTSTKLPAGGATSGASQTVTQTFDPTHLRIDDASRVTAPEGWTTTYSSDGVTFGVAPATASAWAQIRAIRTTGSVAGTAATGGSSSTSVAAPSSGSFTGAGGGDGWNVFFDNANHVFNVWHHNGQPWMGYNPKIDCHTRTGASCGSGWPFAVSDAGQSVYLNTGMHSTGWVDTATGHLWFPTNDRSTHTGFACVDVSNLGSGAGQGPAWCGGSITAAFKILGSGGPSAYSDGTLCSQGSWAFGCVDGLAVVGSRIYTVEARTGAILCLDMAASGGTGAACSGQPYVLSGVNAAPTRWNGAFASGGSWVPSLLAVDGRIVGTGRASFVDTSSPVRLFCLTGDTGAACPGWTAPKSISDTFAWLTYAEPSASGTINGVCVRPVSTTSAGSPTCYDLGGSTITGASAVGSSFRQTVSSENMTGAAITVGTRVLWGNGSYDNAVSKAYCSNAATSADCTGWPVATQNYSIVVDPLNDSCFWLNSDSAGISQLSVGGSVGCAGIAPPSATFTVSGLVANQRVDCTTAPTWGALSLTSPASGTYSTATLTVLDASGVVVSSGGTTWRNVAIGADGRLDLTALRQADTGTNPQFVVSFTGRTNSDPIATTITAPSYAPELCARLTAQEVPCPHVTAPAGSLLGWTSAVTGEGVQGATAIDAAHASVTFANAATAACAPAPATPRIPIAPPPPRVTSPQVSPSGTTIVTVVTVTTPGTVHQTGISSGRTACTSSSVTVRRAGSVTVRCVLTPSAVARLGSAPMRIRLTTTLRNRAGGVSKTVRIVTVRRHAVQPEPVTG